MKQELRKEIEEFFDSIGDELNIDELTTSFYDANTLLRKVLDEDDSPMDDPRLTKRQKRELGYE